MYRSFPRRSKNSCGFTTTRKYKSPGGAPIVPALPLPGTRTRPIRSPHPPESARRWFPCAGRGLRRRTSCTTVRSLPCTPAARARHIKFHFARSLLNRARPTDTPCMFAANPPRPSHGTFRKCPCRVIESFLTAPRTASQKSISIWYSRSPPGSCSSSLAPPRPPLKNWLKRSRKFDPPPCPARARSPAKIESAKIKIDVLPVAGGRSGTSRRNIVAVEAVLVVHLPLLRIGQHVVGFLQLLEFFLRGFVARIQIGVVLPRQFPKRRANILRAGFPRHSQQLVIILFRCRRHLCTK